MRISDWSSDVCSSDLCSKPRTDSCARPGTAANSALGSDANHSVPSAFVQYSGLIPTRSRAGTSRRLAPSHRSEEHTSELQSLMRISYAVFCLKKKKYEQENVQPSNKHNS